jgi:hypothetical protein
MNYPSGTGGSARNSRWLSLGIPNAHQYRVVNSGRPLTDEVLAYLLQRPQAQDTVEGIAEWWLLEQRIRHAVADVEVALSELVGNDFLVARQCGDGRTYYGLNRDKEREIRRHLRQAEAAQETTPDSDGAAGLSA